MKIIYWLPRSAPGFVNRYLPPNKVKTVVWNNRLRQQLQIKKNVSPCCVRLKGPHYTGGISSLDGNKHLLNQPRPRAVKATSMSKSATQLFKQVPSFQTSGPRRRLDGARSRTRAPWQNTMHAWNSLWKCYSNLIQITRSGTYIYRGSGLVRLMISCFHSRSSVFRTSVSSFSISSSTIDSISWQKQKITAFVTYCSFKALLKT